jgi:hypothetical protein
MDLNLYEFISSYHFIIYANPSHGFMMKVKQIKVKGQKARARHYMTHKKWNIFMNQEESV